MGISYVSIVGYDPIEKEYETVGLSMDLTYVI